MFGKLWNDNHSSNFHTWKSIKLLKDKLLTHRSCIVTKVLLFMKYSYDRNQLDIHKPTTTRRGEKCTSLCCSERTNSLLILVLEMAKYFQKIDLKVEISITHSDRICFLTWCIGWRNAFTEPFHNSLEKYKRFWSSRIFGPLWLWLDHSIWPQWEPPPPGDFHSSNNMTHLNDISSIWSIIFTIKDTLTHILLCTFERVSF